MGRCILFLIFVTTSKFVFAGDFGPTGLIDIPSARMMSDGLLSSSASRQSRYNAYSLTYQATPWLEGTFRYTGYHDWFFWDRNYEAKLLLLRERKILPQVAVGIRDMVGSGFQGAEYLVGSKKIGNLCCSVWGMILFL